MKGDIMKFKTILVLVLLFVLLISIPGVAAEGIIAGLGEEPDTLDPNVTSRFHDYVVLSHVIEPLFTLDKDYKAIPLLLEDYDWEVKDQGSEMRVKLKENILFHNGEEMTTEDVKYSYNRYFELSPLANYLLPENGGINEMEIINDYEMIFHFEADKPLALYFMADHHVGIMPKSWLEETSSQDIGRNELIGTGPLMFESWVSGDRIILTRNEDYSHAPAYLSTQGPAKTPQLTIRIIPEDSTLMGEIITGGIDFTFDIAPSSVRPLENQPDIRVETTPTYSAQYMAVNMTKDIFNDKEMRMAIAHAINKEEIANSAWFGVGEPIDGLINKAVVGYWSGIEDVAYDFNPEKSRELLDDLGWIDENGDGVREKDGEELELTLITFSDIDQWRIAGEVVQAQLADIGIDVDLRAAEVGATYDRAEAADFDIGIFRNTWWLGQPYLRFLTHSTSIPTSNYAHYSNPELDENIEIAGDSMDPEERERAINRVQEIIVDSAVWVPLVANVEILVANEELKGVDELIEHPWWPAIARAILLHK